MNNIQKCQEAQKQGLRVQVYDARDYNWCEQGGYFWNLDDCKYRIHPDDEHKFINPELKTENSEKISEKPFKFSEKSSESSENPKEFMEILSEIQKTLLKSSKDFKFSYETQGDDIKIEVLIQKDSVKQEDEGWISNIGNDTYTWPDGYGVWHDTLIECTLRNGSLVKHLAGNIHSPYWNEVDNESRDIVKFRIVKQ